MANRSAKSLFEDAIASEQSGDLASAVRIYRAFLVRFPENPNAMRIRARAAQLSVTQGKYEEAISMITRPSPVGDPDAMTLYTLAQACAYAGRLDDAQDALDKTLALEPGFAAAIARLITLLQYQGLSDQAQRVVDDAASRSISSWEIDHSFAQLAPSTGRLDDACKRIDSRLGDPSTPPYALPDLHYAQAALLELGKDYQGAWDATTRANALKGVDPKQLKTGLDQYRTRIDRLIEIFTPETLQWIAQNRTQNRAQNNDTSDAPPEIIMIAGLPRSGTTLFEQILDAHPRCAGIGETQVLIRMAHEIGMSPEPSLDTLRSINTSQRSRLHTSLLKRCRAMTDHSGILIDKHPGNDEHLGFLATIAPRATMILTRRDPREIALSCYFKNFAMGNAWTTDMDMICDMIEMRLKLHEHWRKVIPSNAPWITLIEGNYESMVSDPQAQTKELIASVGLEWDDACLRFSERKRLVPTLQPHQAAQGVYTGSLAKWMHYASQMGGSLDRLNAICERFGYPV